MSEHYRVTLESLEIDPKDHVLPWSTRRDCIHLDLAIATALESSENCLDRPTAVVVAEVVQHVWEGHGIDPDRGWPGAMEKFEALYRAALEMLDSYEKRPKGGA